MRLQLDSTLRRSTLLVAAALTAVAAGIHFRYVPENWNEYVPFGLSFVAFGAIQAAATLGLLSRHPGRRVVYGAIAVNLGIAALWAYTRVVGVPIGPNAGEKEVVGFWDALCTGIEVVAAIVLAFALTRGGQVDRPVPRAREYQYA